MSRRAPAIPDKENEAQHGARVARFAADARRRTLPAEVSLKTKIHIIDSLAAIVSGAALEAGIAGQRYATAFSEREQASIVGTDFRAPLVEAALANGMAAHANESDDSHEESQTHPGCGVLPAALAVAEMEGSSGLDFLHAVHLGYEMTIRFGEALAPAMSFARSSLSCHAYGPLFGAGFAAGSLMGFDADKFQILLNYLAQEASGLTTWRLDGAHTLKSYVFAGMPASNGVKAAALVRSGFTGSGDVLDPADRNFFDAISAETKPELLFRDLGTRHKILETDIKKYPVGFPIAAPLSALEDIMTRTGVEAGDVEAVRIFYHPDWYKVTGDENRMPDLNLRHCMAATAVEGALTFAASHDANRMQDPEIVAFGQRISFLDAEPDQDRFEARVELVADGAVHRAAQGRHVLGRKENPMSARQVHDKAIELMSTVITREAALHAIAIVEMIEQAQNINALIATLNPASGSAEATPQLDAVSPRM
jgi:2-methylcitrate dehydratase PrpD